MAEDGGSPRHGRHPAPLEAAAPPSLAQVDLPTAVQPPAEAAPAQPAQPVQPPGPSDAPPAQLQPPGPTVEQCWQTAFDHNSQRWYYYNTATLERQWHPPASWLPPPPSVALRPLPPLHPAHAAAMAAAAHAAVAHQLAQAASAASAAADPAAAAAGGAAVAGREPGGSQEEPGAAEPGAEAGSSAAQPRAGSGAGSKGRDGREAACREAAGPPSERAGPAQLPSDAAAATAAAQPAVPTTPGYYYLDAYGVLQGPFSKDQLMSWRGVLPMDLVVRHRPQPAEAGEGLGAQASPVHSMELAQVLGDGELLARWREDNAGRAAAPNSAPPAEAFERELLRGGGYSDYAAAALAGLPASDEAVEAARLAAFSGRSIQDLLAFSYGNGGIGDYTATALHSRGRGRVRAADAQAEGLYDEMGRWADSSTLEEQLAQAAEQRRRGLSGKELQALKVRKQEMKRRKQMEWLTR